MASEKLYQNTLNPYIPEFSAPQNVRPIQVILSL